MTSGRGRPLIVVVVFWLGFWVGRATLSAQGGIDPEEGPVTLNFQSSLKLKVALGAVEPLMTQGEWGIQGGAPDGHLSAESWGGTVRSFFSCWNGTMQLSCLSETPTIDAFGSLAGLFLNMNSTAFQTVLEGPIANDPYESQYAALTSTWRDPATGIIHGWYHAEIPVPGCAFAFYASVGYAMSHDDGHSFVKQQMVVTSHRPLVPAVCFGQGAAHPHVIASGAYLYMLYDSWVPPDFTGGGITIARASKTTPSAWTKYYQGVYTQPGLGGLRTILIANGTQGQQPWSASAIWSTAAGKFLLVYADFNHDGAIYLRTSANLLAWSVPKLLIQPASAHAYTFPTLLGPTDDTMGSAAFLYFGRYSLAGFPGIDTLLARRSFTLLGSGSGILSTKGKR